MIVARFTEGETRTYTKTCYQHDKNQRLAFEGITYAENTEVHFANSETSGVSYAVVISGNSVPIPDAFFATGEYIYAWLYGSVRNENDSGNDETPTPDTYETMLTIVIPVRHKPDSVRIEERSRDYTVQDENLIFFATNK